MFDSFSLFSIACHQHLGHLCVAQVITNLLLHLSTSKTNVTTRANRGGKISSCWRFMPDPSPLTDPPCASKNIDLFEARCLRYCVAKDDVALRAFSQGIKPTVPPNIFQRHAPIQKHT